MKVLPYTDICKQEANLSLTCLLTLYILTNVMMNVNPNKMFIAPCLVAIAIFIILLTNMIMWANIGKLTIVLYWRFHTHNNSNIHLIIIYWPWWWIGIHIISRSLCCNVDCLFIEHKGCWRIYVSQLKIWRPIIICWVCGWHVWRDVPNIK